MVEKKDKIDEDDEDGEDGEDDLILDMYNTFQKVIDDNKEDIAKALHVPPSFLNPAPKEFVLKAFRRGCNHKT